MKLKIKVIILDENSTILDEGEVQTSMKDLRKSAVKCLNASSKTERYIKGLMHVGSLSDKDVIDSYLYDQLDCIEDCLEANVAEFDAIIGVKE